MSQKSSVPQAVSFVSQVLKRDSHVLARIAARKLVQEQLRNEGVRVSLVKPAELSAKAQVYLSQHPELYREGLELAQRMGMYERKRKSPKWLDK
jgi:hypothetical protein